jgi:ribonuclease HII
MMGKSVSVPTPDLQHEQKLWKEGSTAIAGLDEAGRGAWAGPVVAAAVILPRDRSDLIEALAGVRDSKLCTPDQREHLFPIIWEVALTAAVGVATHREVEEFNVVGATRLAMMRALAELKVEADALLIDGRTLRLPDAHVQQVSMDRGDQQSLSIAAASILAKVSRDRMMVEYDAEYPGYGFAQHKGYGTPQHWEALDSYGPCDIHRRTWSPVARRLMDALIDEQGGDEHRAGA